MSEVYVEATKVVDVVKEIDHIENISWPLKRRHQGGNDVLSKSRHKQMRRSPQYIQQPANQASKEVASVVDSGIAVVGSGGTWGALVAGVEGPQRHPSAA